MRELIEPSQSARRRSPRGPVVIWNLVRRCNLLCKHCYSISGDVDFPGELSTEEVFAVMDDLRAFGVPSLILSGGEPLLRRDIFAISKRARALGFYTGLSSNGTLIDKDTVGAIADVGYDYVGVSLDGMRETHDRFRRREGAFDAALAGLRLCRSYGIRTGMRFTMTNDNAGELPKLLDLMDDEGIEKFYLSHLVYAGRGNKNRGDDAHRAETRDRMAMLFERALQSVIAGDGKEFVTGNNDADGVWLYLWARERYPENAELLRSKLEAWGGNSTGVNIANIDNLGNVHPDTMWSNHTLGNVRQRPFSEIWTDLSDPILAGLRMRPRPLEGRCGGCRHLVICGGNTRVRALQLTGNPWAEDPACYLTDAEVGDRLAGSRVELTPFRSRSRVAALT
ncbi:MAG: heme d1 biosynthesis radical SAM protein NirJ [Hyphomicrobiales bacterium]